MALTFRDRVFENFTTTGTGTITLAGAVTGYRTFASALTDGDTVHYSIAGADSTEWEVGEGVYSAGTLTRATVYASSNSGNLVSFSAGTKTVALTAAATDIGRIYSISSGQVQSGAIIGAAGGGPRNIASGTIGTNDLAAASVQSGQIASGQIGANHHSANSVLSGHISSGQVGDTHLADSSVRGNHIASGAITSGFFITAGSIFGPAIGTGITHIASGSIGSTTIAANGVVSGHIRSGNVIGVHLANSAVQSGHIASGQVSTNHLAQASIQSGHIQSGQISTMHLASGAQVSKSQAVVPFGGNNLSATCEEPISGTRAVCMSQSGNLRIAMAGVSGRMPAIGVVVSNVASGQAAEVFSAGYLAPTSGLVNFSGNISQLVWVGRSGHIVTTSGNAGGVSHSFTSGDVYQQLGVATSHSGFVTPAPFAYRLASG